MKVNPVTASNGCVMPYIKTYLPWVMWTYTFDGEEQDNEFDTVEEAIDWAVHKFNEDMYEAEMGSDLEMKHTEFNETVFKFYYDDKTGKRIRLYEQPLILTY